MAVMTLENLPRISFGDSPEMADWLLGLVLTGEKTATCWAAIHGDLGSAVGRRYVARDSQGRDRALLECVALIQRRFDEVDDDHAHAEGEDERTLESWRATHQEFFTRDGTFAPDMMLWCHRFKLVEILGEGAIQ